ncbi:Kinetochore scaffold 1 [Lemmus lemmus]
MDLTASHTVMITKGLSNYTKSDNSTKIDTTSFLENLKNHAEESRIKKKLECPIISISQNTFPEKINSDNFIKRLKTGKYSTSLDKENSEIPVCSKESNSVSSIHQMHVPLNVDVNSSNRTRIFSEQDDGMDLTQCHTACIQTLIPPSGQDNLGGFKRDTVIYGNDFMELTANYTTWLLPSENNLSETETKTQNVMVNFTTVDESKTSEKKTVLKDKLNAAFQVSFLNPENKIHITKSHNTKSETHTVSQINQGASTFDKTSNSLCSSPTIQGYKTIFYSSSNDAMELTKCLSSTKEEKSLLKPDGNYSKVCASPVAGPLIEKTTYSEEDNMEITKSHTIVIDNEMFTQGQENIKKEITDIPVFEKEMILQNHITASEDEKMNVNYITVPQVFKEGLQESLTNTLSDRRIELLAGEDTDLPESYTSQLRSQVIPTTFDLASKNFTESYSQSKNPSVQDQNSKLHEPQRKNLDDPTPDYSHKIISSEEEQTMDLTKSHTIVIGFGPSEIEEQSKTNLEHRNSQLTTVNRQIDVSIPIEKTIVTTNDMDMLKDRSIQKPEFLKEKQNVKICERESAHGLQIDKTILFSEGNENEMDVTRSYTVKINHRSLLDKHDSPLPMAGTSKTILYACGQDEMEITRSHTTALECKIISPDEITPSHPDNAVMSIEGHEELEMTKSHTVFIDYQAEANSVLPDRLELSKKKCLQKPKGMSTTAEETVSISKNNESNHLASKGSQLTILEEGSSTTWKNAKDVQKPRFLNELLPSKTQRRKSLRLQNNETITFPENAKNNRDTTQSSVVEISNKINLQDGEDISFVPLTGTFKPVLSAHTPEDMEISRSQTTALENKTDPADEITTIPMDNTVMFLDNFGDLDVTKSHTVFIECQVKEKVLHEYTKLGMERTENFSGPDGDTCIQEASDSIVSSNVSCFTRVKPSLNNLNGKIEDILDFQTVHILPPAEQSLEVGNQAHNNMSIAQTTEMYNLGSSDGRNEESENLHTGAKTTSLPLKAVVKNKRRCSLGIFLPKFPNKKNCSITVVDDLEQIPADGTDLNHLETQLVSSKDSYIGAVAAKVNLSPSQYINEENLPTYPDEMLSSDSITIDTEEKALIDTHYKEILPSECKIEICNAPKRTWVQEDDNVIINEKKIRTHDSTQNQEVSCPKPKVFLNFAFLLLR